MNIRFRFQHPSKPDPQKEYEVSINDGPWLTTRGRQCSTFWERYRHCEMVTLTPHQVPDAIRGTGLDWMDDHWRSDRGNASDFGLDWRWLRMLGWPSLEAWLHITNGHLCKWVEKNHPESFRGLYNYVVGNPYQANDPKYLAFSKKTVTERIMDVVALKNPTDPILKEYGFSSKKES